MISTSTGFKTAIKSSSRRIKARLLFPDKTIEDVDLIEIDSYLTDEEDFIIGTANMDVAKIEISDDPLSPIFYDFNGKEVEIQLGVTLSDSSVEYHSIGRYTVEKSDRKNSKIYLELVDRMYKADMDYTSNLSYPATLSQILASAASQSGIVLDSTTFLNSDHIVNKEPVYEGITCRQVFAYIAELAGGYARINRLGRLTILSLGSLSVVNITGDHYIDWKKAESAPGIIDKLIIKNGEESASSGTGTNIYSIVDNIFVSNPSSIVENIFSSISTVDYKAGELNWIGDFSLELGDKVTVDGEETYILNRKLKYSGGLRETVKIPGKSNIEKNSTGKPNTNLEIRDIKTKIKIISGEIQQVIENGVTRTEWQQTIDGFNQTVSEIELTPGPEGQSAYEAAVANGFTGTIQEWLVSLEGPPGPQGDPGLPGLQGEKGEQGIPGPRGADGLSSYTHIAYANSADGTVDFSLSDPSRDYIGMYVDNTLADSTNPALYNWSKIKGADGSQGIPGSPGPDGLTSYLHIAYATNATGTTGFSTTDSTGKTYIGQYTDFTATDSTDPTKYSWTLIKGDKGDQGPQGIPGIQGPPGPQLYTWVKYADTPTSGMSDSPTGKTYIGLAYNKITDMESSSYGDYSWSLIKGDQGPQGPSGTDGQTLYTWIKYSAAADGTNPVDDPTGAKYIGIAYNKTTAEESTNKADYTWSRMEGQQGIQGPAGPTLYTWVKYADTPTSGMSDFPDGKTYMGIAYNKTTATESSTYADYSWSLIKGADGSQGIQGPPGANGQTTYTWVKYADTVTGTGMSDSPTGKRFLGLAHNKTTATESTNAADYQWSPLYDNVQVGGRNLIHRGLLSVTIDTTEDFTLSGWSSTFMDNQKVLETFKEGAEYTLSFDMELTERTTVPTYYAYQAGLYLYSQATANDVVFYNSSLKNLGDKFRIVQTFVCPPLTDQRIIFYTNRYTTNGGSPIGLDTVRFTNLKLEKGNIATDWTPAPEDIDSRFVANETQIQQNKSDILLKASKTEVEAPILKQATAPDHLNGRLWLDTSVTPNVLKRSTGSAWVKVTPTTGAEIGLDDSTITQKVEQNTTTLAKKSEIEQTVSEWTAKFDSIAVGARNLVLDSGKLITNSDYKIAEYFLSESLIDGEEVTITLKGTLASTKTEFLAFNSGGTVRVGALSYKGDGLYTLTCNWVVGAAENNRLTIWVADISQIGTSSIEWIKLERGNKSTDWSQAPEELYSGITKINKDGINVSKSASDVNTQIANDGLSVRDGDIVLANFGESGAIIPSVESNVLNTVNYIGTHYVGSSREYNSLNSMLDSMFGGAKKNHHGAGDINITLEQDLNEDVLIEGLRGVGRLVINLNNKKITGRITVRYCTIPVYIINGTIKRIYGSQGIVAQGNSYVQVSGCNLDNNGGYFAIEQSYGGNLHMQACDIVGANSMADVNNACVLTVSECKGNLSSYAFRLKEGAKVFASISIPAGGGLVSASTGYHYIEQGTVSRVNSSYSPPPVTSQTFTQTFTSATFDTLQHGSTSVDSYYGAAACQNRWDSNMNWKDGRVRLSNAIFNFFNGGSSITIKYRLRRKNSTHGTSSAVKPAPYNHSATFSTGAIRGGWTSWATVSSSLFTSGGATLTFYNGVQGASGYAIWDAIEVEVTVTKQV